MYQPVLDFVYKMDEEEATIINFCNDLYQFLEYSGNILSPLSILIAYFVLFQYSSLIVNALAYNLTCPSFSIFLLVFGNSLNAILLQMKEVAFHFVFPLKELIPFFHIIECFAIFILGHCAHEIDFHPHYHLRLSHQCIHNVILFCLILNIISDLDCNLFHLIYCLRC